MAELITKPCKETEGGLERREMRLSATLQRRRRMPGVLHGGQSAGFARISDNTDAAHTGVEGAGLIQSRVAKTPTRRIPRPRRVMERLRREAEVTPRLAAAPSRLQLQHGRPPRYAEHSDLRNR